MWKIEPLDWNKIKNLSIKTWSKHIITYRFNDGRLDQENECEALDMVGERVNVLQKKLNVSGQSGFDCG